MTGSDARTRVLVVDDHAVVRSGLTLFLHGTGDLRVVGEAADGLQAVALVQALSPDVVLMDLSMPHMDGVEATRRIRGSGSRARIIALTSFCDRERLLSILEAGAVGYVLKDSAPEEIVRAVRAAAAGQSPLDPRAAQILLTARRDSGSTGRSGGVADLTARELEVLTLLLEGMSNRRLARQLGITESTVKAHLTRVSVALGVTDRTLAALWAQRHGVAATRQDGAPQPA